MNECALQVNGFVAAAVKSGIRGKDRLDMALIYSQLPATAAGVFTTNRVKAAPVLLDMECVKGGQARAILVNSGIANACTGDLGMENARETIRLVAGELGIEPQQVLVASTGVIGMQLDLANFRQGIPPLTAALQADGFEQVSRAMMTTDTVPKAATRTCIIGGRPVTLLGLAKGAGMIMPNMATMLSFVMTDANIAAPALQAMLNRAVATTFNAITVDGDTSTNDSVLLLANGAAGNGLVEDEEPAFQEALDDLLKELAMKIVKDGEGATKLVAVRVKGAVSEEAARQAAQTIANSPLVKTAFFGEDANWGRIMGALGRAGIDLDPNRVDIHFDGVCMVRDGLGQGKEAEADATRVLKQAEFVVTVDLKSGPASWRVYTCDFSIDYVKINADYRS